jgi:hypothetical protein
MFRLLLAVCGPLAILVTTAIFAIHISIAVMLTHSPTRAISILSAVLEMIVLFVLGCLLSINASTVARQRVGVYNGMLFGSGMFACALAAASSVATIISLDRAPGDVRKASSAVSGDGFLYGSSAALGLSFVFQVLFMTAHFFSTGAAGHFGGLCLSHSDDEDSANQSYIKSVRYSQTSPLSALARQASVNSNDRPYSSAEQSLGRPSSSIRSSISKEFRGLGSKTKLLSFREKRRPPSLESHRTSLGDSYSMDDFPPFEPQATSPVTLPRPVFLETIPASPTNSSRSRSPSPPPLPDLEPPRMAHRSRSYSPVGRLQERNSSTPSLASSELHIHPLFRSDSPNPPPMATPGTNVLAAPQAGQVITHRKSVLDLKRMRSGSLPASPSPLSRQGSVENMGPKKAKEEQANIEDIREIREEEERDAGREMDAAQQIDFELPPPIPDWILTAGSRNSLTDYNSRKLKDADVPLPPGA